jgi:hypothetical protein
MEAEKEVKDLATVCLPGIPVLPISLSLLLTRLKLKMKVTPVTEQFAVTMAAVLATARYAVDAVSVMRVMNAVKI